MRVAIATDWFAPRRGGVETQVADLATHLARRGHDVDVLTTTPGPSDADAAFRLRRLDVTRMPGAGFAISPGLPRAVTRELARGYDVVHCHVSVVSPLGYTAAIAARLMGLPTVVTFHSVLRHKRHLLRMASAIAGLTDSRVAWTAVSGAVARQAQSALATPVTVLPNGTTLDFWRLTPPSPAAGMSSQITLVSAGRLERKKRPLPLIRAFMEARRRTGADAQLVLAGDGSARAAVERAVSKTDGHARLVGWQTPPALRAMYVAADAFVTASRYESFGIAALEARAAGLPVIAMSSAGCSDFLTSERDALLCADDRDLMDQLTRLLTDAGLRARLRSAGVHLDRYDWDAVVGEHERVYRQAISFAGSGPAAARTA